MAENQQEEVARNDAAKRKKKRHTRKILSRVLTTLFVLGVAALLVLAAVPKPIPVDVATLARGVLEVTIDEDGVTQPSAIRRPNLLYAVPD